MSFNPPSTIRTALYVMMVFINAMMAVLVSSEVKLPVLLVAFVAGFNAVVGLMASANVTPDEE